MQLAISLHNLSLLFWFSIIGVCSCYCSRYSESQGHLHHRQGIPLGCSATASDAVSHRASPPAPRHPSRPIGFSSRCSESQGHLHHRLKASLSAASTNLLQTPATLPNRSLAQQNSGVNEHSNVYLIYVIIYFFFSFLQLNHPLNLAHRLGVEILRMKW